MSPSCAAASADLQALALLAQLALRGPERLLGAPEPRRVDALRVLEGDRSQLRVLVVASIPQRPPSTRAASAVPSTRARILANAVSREVEVSSQNGEKPQSSVVPSCASGM